VLAFLSARFLRWSIVTVMADCNNLLTVRRLSIGPKGLEQHEIPVTAFSRHGRKNPFEYRAAPRAAESRSAHGF
jgi:hypothetical protein